MCLYSTGNAIVFINLHLMCSARCPKPHISLFTMENYRLTSKNVANFFVLWHNNFLCLHKIVHCFGWEIMDFKAVSISTIMLKRRLPQRQETTSYAKGKHAISI